MQLTSVSFPTTKKKKSERNLTVVPSSSTSFLKYFCNLMFLLSKVLCTFNTALAHKEKQYHTSEWQVLKTSPTKAQKLWKDSLLIFLLHLCQNLFWTCTRVHIWDCYNLKDGTILKKYLPFNFSGMELWLLLLLPL